jgi:hypothetical protein
VKDMKTISKIKVAIGSIAVMPLVLIITVGLAAPAVAPSKADALTVVAHQKMATLKAYENADSLSDKDLVKLLGAVGFEGNHLKEAWAVAKKESHGNPLNHNGNRKTGDNSYGLFQVNMLGQMGNDRRAQFGLASNAELLNPVKNAQVAYHMSNGGKNWSAWKGVHTTVVKYWMNKYPYKATTTQAHKAKAKAVAKHKAKAKQKPKQ